MLFILLAYLGGALTIVSPCILPVLPFVFARADRPFSKSGLPLLVGMALTFVLVSLLASLGGGWVVQANLYGRYAALALLALFALTMIFPQIAEYVTRPLVRLGNSLSQRASANPSVLSSLLLGVATGLLWAPCAGPILGLILTGAALGGGRLWSGALLLAYGLGAASSLALVLLGGQKVFAKMKSSLGFDEKLRKGIGVAILLAVGLIAFGLDRGVLSQLSTASTGKIEQGLLNNLGAHKAALPSQVVAGVKLDEEGPLPLVPAAADWVNSPALTKQSLHGKVVLVDFWTYSCINCIRTLPTIEALSRTYKDNGLVVIGVHTPEFAFERERSNVEMAIKQFGITYPVALDNDYSVWNAFSNEYWPAHYLIDANGNIRYHHFGEGGEAETESAIRALLSANGAHLGAMAQATGGSAIEAASDDADDQSPETYLGSDRGERFSGAVASEASAASAAHLSLNHWDISGSWDRKLQNIRLLSPKGTISFHFHARDVHLVLGPSNTAKKIRFRVMLDGQPAGKSGGADIDASSEGIVTEQRLYQLIRQSGSIHDHIITIEFEDPGVQAFAFTFG